MRTTSEILAAMAQKGATVGKCVPTVHFGYSLISITMPKPVRRRWNLLATG